MNYDYPFSIREMPALLRVLQNERPTDCQRCERSETKSCRTNQLPSECRSYRGPAVELISPA